jgi:chromosome segregation ATPase
MTDGNTVATINPVSENDMSIFKQTFERFAQSVVDASQVQGTIASIRSELEALRNEIASVRAHNVELDNELTYVRQARDNANADANILRDKVSSLEAFASDDAKAMNDYRAEINRLSNDLSSAKQDRDDASYKNLELSEALEKANAKLAKFKAIFDEEHHEPTVQTPVPDMPATPSRIYANESGYWSTPGDVRWDDDRSEYYKTVAA